MAIRLLQSANSMHRTFITAVTQLVPHVSRMLFAVGVQSVWMCLETLSYKIKHVLKTARLLEKHVQMTRNVVEGEV